MKIIVKTLKSVGLLMVAILVAAFITGRTIDGFLNFYVLSIILLYAFFYAISIFVKNKRS